MKLLSFFILMLAMSCGSSKTVNETIVDGLETKDNLDELIEAKVEEPEIIRAKVVRKKAYNKAGKEMPYAGDIYLAYRGKEFFVKFMESEITYAEMETLIDQEHQFKVIFREGLWDTDNPEVQSRIGEYVAILELQE